MSERISTERLSQLARSLDSNTDAGRVVRDLIDARAEIARLKGALAPFDLAALTLEAYEHDYGEPLPEDHEIGRVEESRGSASFRIRVGHLRRAHAELKGEGA